MYVTVNHRAGPAPSIVELSGWGQAIKLMPFITPGVQEVWRLLLNVRRAGETWPCDEYLAMLYDVRERSTSALGTPLCRQPMTRSGIGKTPTSRPTGAVRTAMTESGGLGVDVP